MNDFRPYVRAIVLVSAPALVVAAATGMPMVAALSLGFLTAGALFYPRITRVYFVKSIVSLLVIGILAVPLTVAAYGFTVYATGIHTAAIFVMIVGALLIILGTSATKTSVSVLVLPQPVPTPIVVMGKPDPAPQRTPLPAPVVQVDPPKPALPPPKKMPRELVMLGGRQFPAYETDEHFYFISGPPGSYKTTLQRLFLVDILKEVLDPECESTLIAFDPQRELWAWIASMLPQGYRIPFHLFCPSDMNSCTLDWDGDYRSLTDYETFANAIFRKHSVESQPFFGNAARTLVEQAIAAIKARLGTWDLRLLILDALKSRIPEEVNRCRRMH